MEIEIKTRCRNCNKEYFFKNKNDIPLWNYSFCKEKCNEEYFLKNHSGLVPKKYLREFHNLYKVKGAIQ